MYVTYVFTKANFIFTERCTSSALNYKNRSFQFVYLSRLWMRPRNDTWVYMWFYMVFNITISTLTKCSFFFNIAKRVERASRVRRKIEFYDSSFYHKPVCLSRWTEIQLIYITRATLMPGQFRETAIWNLEFGIVQGGSIQAAPPRCASQLSQSLLLITVHSVLAARDPLLLGRRGSETVGKPIC